MNSEIIGEVTEWETVSFGGGYAGLQKLADREFSGAIKAGSTWAFMLNGKLIGIREGSLAAFESADGTAYEAPDTALPLLFTMQSGDNEKQAEYYTKDTALAEADATLTDGNFTGYIELSENVHSGDYYVVYYGGKSMSAAFVGNNRSLLTEEEAFKRANDEIGIYNVFAADIDVVDIPEVAEMPAEDTTDDAETTGGSTGERTTATAESQSDGIEIAPAEPDAETNPADDTAGETTPVESPPSDQTTAETEETAAERRTAEPTRTDTTTTETTAADTTTAETNTETPDDTAETTTDSTAEQASNRRQQSPRSTTAATSGANSDGGTTTTAGVSQSTESDGSAPFQSEAEWRNTTTIPSLDPSEDSDNQPQRGSKQRNTQTTKQSSGEKRLSREQLTKRLKQAEEVMEKAEAKHAELVEQRDAAEAERDEAQKRVKALETKLAEAEAEIEELESKLSAAKSAAETDETTASETAQSGPTLSPADALSGTNLFVRYDSKGEATLKTAHAGKADREAVNENLRIEHHTAFEADAATVEGQPFEAFLAEQIEFRFTSWLVRELLFEIQATGTQSGMHGIFDAIPKIDRIELHGVAELGTDEDDEPIEGAFDLIVRNKHGSPLFVANFDESKEPVGADMIEDLIRAGSELRGREDDFGAAFAVTTSYFSPDALEATEDATGGGLLSRSRGKSFVTLSRKTGFHLCLVDRIDDGFDLREPEI